MPLSPTELQLLEDACANRDNHIAAGLLNVFAGKCAADVLHGIADAPVTIRIEFMDSVRKAIDEQRLARTRH